MEMGLVGVQNATQIYPGQVETWPGLILRWPQCVRSQPRSNVEPNQASIFRPNYLQICTWI
jgi:hypothetical protein